MDIRRIGNLLEYLVLY